MGVLVAYASRHGSTAEIAERIAVRLEEVGVEAACEEVTELEDVEGYDAYVVGSDKMCETESRQSTRVVGQWTWPPMLGSKVSGWPLPRIVPCPIA